jgi:hypothetical protein
MVVYSVFDQVARCRSSAIGLAQESRDSLPEDTEQNKKNKSCSDEIPEELIHCCSVVPW